MKKDLGRPLFPSRQIQKRVRVLATAIRKHYAKKPLIVIGLMNGSLFFLVDLLRHLPPDFHVECWRVQSYAGKSSSGKVKGLDQCRGDFSGHHVLIIDDILDTGLTLHAVGRRALECGARSVKICVLLRKDKARHKKVNAEWVGFDIQDEFVIGYGLDLDGQYRGLKDIRILNE